MFLRDLIYRLVRDLDRLFFRGLDRVFSLLERAHSCSLPLPQSLKQAIRSTSQTEVLQLLEQGVDVNCSIARWLPEDESGEYHKYTDYCAPLHLAVEFCGEAIVRMLIERGANVDLQRSDGATPLHLAAKRGDEAIVKLLTESGANVNAVTEFNEKAFKYYGLVHSDDDAEEFNECQERLMAELGDGSTPLSLAMEEGHQAVVRLLLERGADPHLDPKAKRDAKQREKGRSRQLPPIGPNPHVVTLELAEHSLGWKETTVPLQERGVRFSWLDNFVKSIYWEKNEPAIHEARSRKFWSLDLYEISTRELVDQHVRPLTSWGRVPLYARVPDSDRGKPTVFLSHAWANPVLAAGPGRYGTLDAFNSRGVAGIEDEFVWVDFACYNQHAITNETIAVDMEGIIKSIGKVAFAVTPTPLFDRIWCLWELLAAWRTGAGTRFCVAPGRRDGKRTIVNDFFKSFTSVERATATKWGDYEMLMAAIISAFGSTEAADDHVRNLMRDRMGDQWFELYEENR